MRSAIPTLVVVILALSASAHAQLSAAERAAGWTSLFDGKTPTAWRGYNKKSFPAKGWAVENGTLKVLTGGGGGDIITREKYENFELELEWKATRSANSGILYRVAETRGPSWFTGPEYQILDDVGSGAARTAPHAAGALYDLVSPAAAKTETPAGRFHRTRIVVRNDHAQHWLNGVLVAESPLAGKAWTELVAKSKFRKRSGFGANKKGHICIQDHGKEVAFRNIRIRDLDASMPGEIRLFDGNSFKGWSFHLSDDSVTPRQVWSIRDGVLECSGEADGYLRTTTSYESYVLRLEWRWDPKTKQAGNSGVLLRATGSDRVWPKCFEAQLWSGNVGDFWFLGGYAPKVNHPRARTDDPRNVPKTANAERPIGEWNDYEIVVNGERVDLFVNGRHVNSGTGFAAEAGSICLQSEGSPIHFRNVRLAPLSPSR